MFKPISNSAKLYQQYLRSGNHASKIRIQNLLGKYFFWQGIKVVNEDGTSFSLVPNDWITRTILIDGEYETESLKLCKKILKNGGVFVDLGANFGLYTCVLSENKSVDVYSIEPNYMIMPALLQNIHLNARDNVKVFNVALSDNFQFVGFNLPNKNNLGTASFKVIHEASFSVLSCSLEYIFQSQQLQYVDLIKIDIEGNEFSVLKEFPFEKYKVQNILLEFNKLTSTSLAALHHFFLGKGFLMQDIIGGPFNTFSEEIPENNLWLVNIN